MLTMIFPRQFFMWFIIGFLQLTAEESLRVGKDDGEEDGVYFHSKTHPVNFFIEISILIHLK